MKKKISRRFLSLFLSGTMAFSLCPQVALGNTNNNAAGEEKGYYAEQADEETSVEKATPSDAEKAPVSESAQKKNKALENRKGKFVVQFGRSVIIGLGKIQLYQWVCSKQEVLIFNLTIRCNLFIGICSLFETSG